ncbi:GFA domain-containing protein [Mycena indigotica]|uniref:GFA domain-containing protein n=1 Tax=Mycena indigotica TaxID=2126181 RepID=A0A8H6S2N2_9AGAR|nr:GFA domain-containing protein [Mycena indigotica]KAF7290185.1 GFA domain-containing protein [Mycena indigotica]
MPVLLNGSGYCGAVRFTVDSNSDGPTKCTYRPCSICRKVGGYGGSVTLGGHSETLKIGQGKADIRVDRAVMDRDTLELEERAATSERGFCGK